MNRVMAGVGLLVGASVLGCSRTPPPQVLEVPELGMSIELASVWRPADPSGSENPGGFVQPRIEPVGPNRVRVAKQPKGGTEIAYVTGKFALPFISIYGNPARPGVTSTLDECARRSFEQSFGAVSWALSPSSLVVPGAESRATIVDYQTREGLDLRSEILVLAKDGRCYVFTGTTSQSLWKGQQTLIEDVLSSMKAL